MYFLFERCDANKNSTYVIAESIDEAEYLFGGIDEDEEEAAIAEYMNGEE